MSSSVTASRHIAHGAVPQRRRKGSAIAAGHTTLSSARPWAKSAISALDLLLDGAVVLHTSRTINTRRHMETANRKMLIVTASCTVNKTYIALEASFLLFVVSRYECWT